MRTRPGPLFVGLCGGSGSGKTVLSGELLSALGEASACLSMDGYYREPSHVPQEIAGNYDHPEALDIDLLLADLDRLNRGERVEVPGYHFSVQRRVRGPILEPRPIIILEGILLFAFSEIRSLLGLAVFLDVPSDLRLARRLRRDVKERGRTMESVLHQYFSTVRPMYEEHVAPARHLADLVIDHECSIAESVKTILPLVENRRRLAGSPSGC